MHTAKHRGLLWKAFLVENGIAHLERVDSPSHKITLFETDYRSLEKLNDTNLSEQEEKETKNDENNPL